MVGRLPSEASSCGVPFNFGMVVTGNSGGFWRGAGLAGLAARAGLRSGIVGRFGERVSGSRRQSV